MFYNLKAQEIKPSFSATAVSSSGGVHTSELILCPLLVLTYSLLPKNIIKKLRVLIG
jgi:hypothetical protein